MCVWLSKKLFGPVGSLLATCVRASARGSGRWGRRCSLTTVKWTELQLNCWRRRQLELHSREGKDRVSMRKGGGEERSADGEEK